MKSLVVFALLLATAISASAQVSSHAPTGAAKSATPAVPASAFQVSDKPVARVNAAVLTDRDLLREMLQIFPYASQHNGFPKEQEASIRQGALQMIIFEELVYQEAQRHAAELEQKVQERTRELQQIQESQSRMMLDISHGLQTPLAVFQTKLEQLKGALPGDAGIRQLETSLADVSNFIYNLLKLARLENNLEEISLSPVCLTALLGEIVEEVGTIADMYGISIRQHIAPEIYVSADAKKIRDVIMNLASNAIKYMRDEGKREIFFSLDSEGLEAVLCVSDSGVGIAAADMPHIFERFYRVHNSPGRISGTGLGLSISKRIVEQHRGTLEVQSELGRGTTITMRLPKLPTHT